MEFLVFWLIMGGVVALIANSKGKSPVAWFFYGMLIWPIALVHILVTKSEAATAPAPEKVSAPLPDLVVKHQGRDIRINRADNSASVDGIRFASPEDAQAYIDKVGGTAAPNV